MAEFVQDNGVMRWLVVVAFVVAALIVVGRLTRPRAGQRVDAAADGAHLLMCLVMLAMLIFPVASDPHAMRGILTALTVAFAMLFGERLFRLRRDPAPAPDELLALGYHTVAAAAMLYAMGGHGTDHGAAALGWPAFALAALFVLDALLVLGTAGHRSRRWRWVHPSGGHPLTSALVPHLVMDIGTAFMLIAAIGQ
ncbi:DUF5134 domain-containing protein [Nocardia sp. NPDC059177]|uniref:DUF5134 domain-containing protein n=1 Tax=Nocardia sp. NPDC059177 TaxID=3346759 RepID=UPI0036A2B954